MSIDGEREVRAWLGAALDDVDPGALPFDAVIRQGRTVLIRRRLGVAVAAAVVVGAAVAVPVALHQPGGPLPAAALHRVAVSPPGPGAPKGLIATGRVLGVRWGAVGAVHGNQLCVRWTGFGSRDCTGGVPPRASRSGAPLAVFVVDGARPRLIAGTVRTGVASLEVSLSNGQTLTLRPVPIYGPGSAAWFAFAVPAVRDISRVTEYSKHAELSYAVPFTGDGNLWLPRWLTPNQPALPKPATYLIGSGRSGGQSWSVRAHVGPWGVCIGGTGAGANCFGLTPAELTQGRAARQIALAGGGPGGVTYVTLAVSGDVGTVRLTKADGGSFRARIVNAGGARYCVFPWPSSVGRLRWTAYSAAGRELASGAVP